MPGCIVVTSTSVVTSITDSTVASPSQITILTTHVFFFSIFLIHVLTKIKKVRLNDRRGGVEKINKKERKEIYLTNAGKKMLKQA